MKIITFANESRGYFEAFLQSAKRNNFDVLNVGMGKQWKGYMDRVQQYIKALKTLSGNEIVVICDAYDVVILGSAKECLSKFKSMGTKKVVMATYHSNVFTESIFGKVEASHYYNNISMGCYIGYVNSLLDLLTKFCSKYECVNNADGNDQVYMTQYYTTQCQECILPDHGCRIFYEIDFVSRSSLVDYLTIVKNTEQTPRPLTSDFYVWKDDNKRLYVSKTHSYPVFLHGNGNANLDLFIDKLELKPKTDREDRTKVNRQYISIIIGKILLYILMVVHLFIMYLVNIHVYITKSRTFLFGIIIWNILIVLQWYIFGNCIFTPLENKIQSHKYDDGTEQNFMAAHVNKIFKNEKVTFYLLSLLPVISTVVAVYRLSLGSLACAVQDKN